MNRSRLCFNSTRTSAYVLIRLFVGEHCDRELSQQEGGIIRYTPNTQNTRALLMFLLKVKSVAPLTFGKSLRNYSFTARCQTCVKDVCKFNPHKFVVKVRHSILAKMCGTLCLSPEVLQYSHKQKKKGGHCSKGINPATGGKPLKFLKPLTSSYLIKTKSTKDLWSNHALLKRQHIWMLTTTATTNAVKGWRSLNQLRKKNGRE